jgi:hypothetical protein
MRFAPVHLPEDRHLNGKASQTFLKHYNLCPRSAYLYQTHKGSYTSVEMMRGTALHEILERATKTAIHMREPIIPADVVKAIAAEVLSDPRFPVPMEEHDYLRESVFRWAGETDFDPDAVVAVESLFVLPVAGFEVRCKIDYAAVRQGVLKVEDYKSGRGAPSQESVARKRDDGSYAVKAFQLVLYLLALRYGKRYFVRTCPSCNGEGQGTDNWGEPFLCEECFGKLRIEEEDEDWERPAAEVWEAELVFPGIETRDGLILRRGGTLTAPEMDAYLGSLESTLARVKHSEETGDWPAVVSDEACGMCPAQAACPIPTELRAFQGVLETAEQASETAEVHDRLVATAGDLRKALRSFCKQTGVELRFGNKVWEFVPRSSVRVDREGLEEAWKNHQLHGEPFHPELFQKTSSGTDFRSRDLRPDEINESEGSNG